MLISGLRLGTAGFGLVCLTVVGMGSIADKASIGDRFWPVEAQRTRAPAAFVTADRQLGATPEELAADKIFETAAVGAEPVGKVTLSDTQERQDAAPGADDLKLAFAQTLSINFHGYREISGDFAVNEDSTVSIPAIGRVAIANRTARELEDELGRRVVQHTGRTSTVNVQVKAFNPIFVTGDVQTSGSFAWQRGLRVLHAKALAGGIFRSQVSKGLVGVSTPQMQLGASAVRLKHAFARLERVTAEIEARQTLNIPDRLINLVSYDEAERIIKREEVVLRSKLEKLQSKRAALESYYNAAKMEVHEFSKYILSTGIEVNSHKAHLKTLRDLLSRGSTTKARLFEARSRFHEKESRLAAAKISKAQAEAKVQSFKHKMIELKETREAKLVAQRLKLVEQINEYQVQVDAAVALGLRLKKDTAGAVDDGSVEEIYEIVRNVGDGHAKRFEATQLDEVLPGDVVRIKLRTAPQRPTRAAISMVR